MKKRGQITVFIIIGLLLLIIVGVMLYMSKLNIEEKPIIEPQPVPTEFSYVNDVFRNCLKTLGKDAFIKLGTSGGYINPEEFGFYNVQGMDTISNAIEFAPNSGILIPYWKHMSSSNKCTSCIFNTNIPPLEGGSRSIKSQVENYIEKNINSCLDFTHLEDFAKVDLKGDPEVTVFINEEDVSFKMIYFADITDISNNNKIEVNDYSASLDLKFKRIYNVAYNLYLQYAEFDPLIEQFSLDLLDYYTIGLVSEFPPRFPDFKSTTAPPKFWFEEDVKNSLKYLIADNMKYNRVRDSFGFTLLTTEDEVFNNIVNNYLVNAEFVDNYDLRRTRVEIEYLPWWDFYLSIEPSKGGLIMPDISKFTSFIPIMIQEYNFNYNFAYPVVFMLEEVESFSGDGYNFMFGYEVNVRNDKPFTYEDESLFETTYATPLSEIEPLYFDDERFRTSGEVEIEVVDGITGLPLEDVLVSFTCGHESAFLEKTSLFNYETIISTKLPVCLNGYITGLKEDYFSANVLLNTEIDKSESVTLKMFPIKTFTGNIKTRIVEKRHNSSNDEYYWDLKTESDQFLDSDDTVMLIMEKIPANDQEEPFMVFENINGDEENFNIDLTVGNYTVTATLMRNFGEDYRQKEFVVPDYEMCFEDECFQLNGTVYNSSMFIGGLELDESTEYFEVTPSDMLEDNVLFYVTSANLNHVKSMLDVGEIMSTTEYIANNYEYFKPVFSSD